MQKGKASIYDGNCWRFPLLSDPVGRLELLLVAALAGWGEGGPPVLPAKDPTTPLGKAPTVHREVTAQLPRWGMCHIGAAPPIGQMERLRPVEN